MYCPGLAWDEGVSEGDMPSLTQDCKLNILSGQVLRTGPGSGCRGQGI